MHNRKPDGVESRELSWRDGVVLVPLVACIVALALYPQLILKRTDTSVAAAVAATAKAPKPPDQLVPTGRKVKSGLTFRPVGRGER
jgi:NADH:ubiquinone oxidoreductase subunit 4 (subunit M)